MFYMLSLLDWDIQLNILLAIFHLAKPCEQADKIKSTKEA